MSDFAPDQPDFYRGDPDAAFRRLRAEDPMHWYEAGRFWCATRHDDVCEISRKPRTFSSAHGTQLFEIPLRHSGQISPMAEGAPSIIRMDPPAHNLHRKLVIGAFTKSAIAALEPRVRALARECLAGVRAGEPFDFVERVAIPLPMYVIAEMLGVPSSDYAAFRRWSDVMIEAGAYGPRPETMGIVIELLQYMVEKAKECRRAPREDVLTRLALAEVEGTRLTEPELGIFCLTLLVAGNETTRNLIAAGMRVLLEHPAQWRQLCADPALVPGAVEEMLRWASPIQNFVRCVRHDVEVAGKTLHAGDYVALFYGSANRDESVFGPDADAFDILRPDANQHVAFGFGEHLCLGAALARLEARVMFEELAALGPGLSLAGPAEPLRTTLVNGVARLPVVLEARA